MIIFIKWATNKWKLDFLIEFSIYLCSVFPLEMKRKRKLHFNKIEKRMMTEHGKDTLEANQALNGVKRQDEGKTIKAKIKNLKDKFKEEAKIFSIITTWSLENSVDTADSMRARGYGTGKRTSYNNYRFTVRDGIILLWSIVLTIATIVALHNEIIITYYYPTIRIKNDVMAYVIFGLLCLTPVLINIWETLRWNRLKSKI